MGLSLPLNLERLASGGVDLNVFDGLAHRSTTTETATTETLDAT